MHRPILPIVLPVLYCFALGESSRYCYNLFVSLGQNHTLIGRVVGHFRWNLFLVLYPIGALGDGLAGVFTISVLNETEPMPYSISMPNQWNFSFNFAYFLTLLPFLYMIQFPINFMHLVRKRREFYAEIEVKNTKID